MNIKTLTLSALLASTATLSFAEVSVNETQQPASEAAAPIVVSDQEVETSTPMPQPETQSEIQPEAQ